MPKIDSPTIELTLVILIALAMLAQAIVMLAAFIALRKAALSMREELERMRSSVVPVLENARDLFTRLKPKVEQTTEDLAAITRSVRAQTADVQSATTEIVARARRQAGRMDSMLSTLLDGLDRAGTFMAETVAKPMRQLSAIMASANAVVESLRSTKAATASRQKPTAGIDNDRFV